MREPRRFHRVVLLIAMSPKRSWGEGPTNMSQISRGMFAAVAISLTLGAAQFASGRDLSRDSQSASDMTATAVNRATKTDRTAGAVRAAVPTQTISFRPGGLSDTSVLVRVPVAQATRNAPSAPLWIRSGDRKPVACEPAVSVLTEVARQLQPGRCIT